MSKLIWDWKITRRFPFLHFYKRKQYIVEQVFENAVKIESLMFAALPVLVSARLINGMKKIFHK